MGFSTRVAALILRFLTLMLLVASLAIIATDKLHYPGFGLLDPPYDLTFKDLYALSSCYQNLQKSYVLSVAAVGCAYTLLVIPFAVISYARQNRIEGSSATMFLIFTDLVFCLLFATGGAAGLGLVVDIQRREDDFDSDGKDFYDSVDASCGLLLAATVCMVAMIMISAHSLSK